MNDNTYGDSSEFAQEFKVCMVCGETNCEAHKDNPLNDDKPVDPSLVMNLRPMKASEWLELFGSELGLSISQQEKDEADAGEKKVIHTDKGHKYVEDENSEGDPEKKEDGFPQNLSIHGGMSIVGKYKDIDKDAERTQYPHVLFLRNESVMSTLSGNVRNVDHFRAKKGDDGRTPGRLDAIKEEAIKHVPALKRRLYLALEAQARTARERNKKRGKVDSGTVSRLVSEGASDIFAKAAYRKDIKTAVSLVLDDSGSMAEIVGYGAQVTGGIGEMLPRQFLQTKAGCVAVLAYALGEVLSNLGIVFEIVSYEDYLGDPWDRYGIYGGYQDPRGKGRFSIEYKGFDEPWSQSKERLVNYAPHSGGSLTYESCVFAANRLCKRTEERKILFQLSDAQTGNHGVQKLYELTTDLWRKAKIQYVGVGILEPTMKEWLKERCEIIERLDKLNDTVFERLAKLIDPS